MNEHDKKERDRRDRSELGPVDNVNDLAPETGVGPTRKATALDRIVTPTESGYFENEGGSSRQLGAPLHLGGELKKDGGAFIAEYEGAYNSYSIPLRSTLRAMGRVKDVSLTGAPMTPSELQSRPELAARFRRLKPNKSDAVPELASNVWSNEQTKMRNDIRRFGAGQHQLTGVIAGFRRVQLGLQKRGKEAQRDSKQHEVDEIEHAAKTLAEITKVAFEAWSAIGEIEELVDAGAALDLEGGMETGEGLPTGDHANPAADPSSAGHGTKTKLHRAAGAIANGAKTTGMIIATAKEHLAKTGHYELSLEGLFTFMIGGTTYPQLQRQIVALDAQIAKLGLDQEAEDFRSATEQLRGFKMELDVRKQDIRSDRVAARTGAMTFARSLGGGDDAIATMYAAEAYQELAQFGVLAAERRREMIEPLWGATHGYVHGHDAHRFVAIGALDDAIALSTNLDAVREQRVYFGQHLPEWVQRAKQWSEFVGKVAGSALIAEENEADRKSGAP